MPKRDPIKPAKLADAIADHIERLILEGVLRPGEKLIAERELAEQLDVSRPSLREALQKLEDKGLLHTTRDGTVVAALVDTTLTDPLARLLSAHPEATFDYLEFRGGVEAMAAYHAALRATDVDREVLRQILDRMERSHRIDDPREEAEADTDLHMAIYDAAHNIVLLHIMRSLADMLRKDVFYNREMLYARRGVREMLLTQHMNIGKAILDGDADRARDAAQAHIDFTGRTLREIAAAEARLEVSLRRIGRSELVATGPRRR